MCCGECKSEEGFVIDYVTRKTSCSECGFELGYYLIDDIVDVAKNETTEQYKGYSNDFVSCDLGNEQNQNHGFDSISITAMSNRLGLLATVKNQASEIFKKVEGLTRNRRLARNVLFAACIYIACRQKDMTRSLKEISSVSNGATKSEISRAIGFVAKALNMEKNWLMQIQASDFIKRFCSAFEMDSQAVKAAQEAAEKYTEVATRSGSPVTVAAVVVYVIARIAYEKKLCKGFIQATGVPTQTMRKTYKDLLPHLSTIIPKWFAKASDLKKLPSP